MKKRIRGTTCFRFEDYLLNPEQGDLMKGTKRVRLQHLPFQVLLLLVERRGEVVLRQELRERLWPNGTFVEFDQGLNTAIRKLRQALGDSTQTPRFVETAPRRGYRFLPPVEELPIESTVEETSLEGWGRPFPALGRRTPVALSLTVAAVLGLLLLLPGFEKNLGTTADGRTLPLSLVDSRKSDAPKRANSEVEDLHSKGVYYLSRASLSEAMESFKRSVRLDPNRSEAYSAIALTLILQEKLSPNERFSQARQAALKALERNPEDGTAYLALSMIKYLHEREWQEAEEILLRICALHPDWSTPHTLYADYLIRVGRSNEALAEIRLARNISPQNLATHSRLADIYFWARQYEKAIQQIESTLVLEPKHAVNHNRLGRYFSEVGRYEDAIGELQTALTLKSGNPSYVADLGYVYGVSGNEPLARQMLHRLHRASKHRYVSPFHIAQIHLGLGEKETALEWLEMAYQEHHPSLTLLRVEPRFDPLRSHPRFQALVRKMNFPSEN